MLWQGRGPGQPGEPAHHCGLVPADNEAAQSSLNFFLTQDLSAAAAGTGTKSEPSRVLGSSQSERL